MLQVHLTMPPNERALRGGVVGGGNELKLDRLHVLSCWGGETGDGLSEVEY
jgi:hypothetical protein